MKKHLLIIPVILFLLIGNSGCFRNSGKESKHAFVVLNIGLLQQKENLEMKNSTILADFATEVVLNPQNDSIKRLNDMAVQMAKLSKELSDFIGVMKVELVVQTDGVDEATAKERVNNPFKVERKGDYDRTTFYFGTSSPPGNTGKAHDLKERLVEYKVKLMGFISDEGEGKKRMEKKLSVFDLNDVEDKGAATWEMFHFYHLPLSAALTELTRWQVICRTAETDCLDYLYDRLPEKPGQVR